MIEKKRGKQNFPSLCIFSMKIYKIKPNKHESLIAWGKELSVNRKEEAIDALKEENCTHEHMELFKIDNDWYVASYMEGENLKPPNIEKEIDRKHKEILRDCIMEKIQTQVIYDLVQM